jgi:hypothetical protein
LSIAGIAAGILSVGSGVGFGVVSLAFLAVTIYQLRSNNQVVERLKSAEDFPLQVIY